MAALALVALFVLFIPSTATVMVTVPLAIAVACRGSTRLRRVAPKVVTNFLTLCSAIFNLGTALAVAALTASYARTRREVVGLFAPPKPNVLVIS